ncbi:hypothetical protein ACFJGW_07510 [Burkholderiaceae bacterium UC74_6]
MQAFLAEQSRRFGLRVWLSAGLCRPFLISDVEGAKSAQDWQLVAQTMAEEATGVDGPCEVWLDRVPAAPRLAVAMRSDAKREIIDALGTHLLSLRPWWSEVLRQQARLRKDTSAIAIIDCEAVTLLLSEPSSEAAWICARSSSVDTATGDDAQAAINRLLMTTEWSGEEPISAQLSAIGANRQERNSDAKQHAVFVGNLA